MVTRVRIFRNPAYQASGPKSLIYALRKYGITPSKDLTRFYRNDKKQLFMKAQDGTSTEVTAANQQNDAFFLAPVSIGTPEQELMLVSPRVPFEDHLLTFQELRHRFLRSLGLVHRS